MTTFAKRDNQGQTYYENVNLPAPSEDEADWSPLYKAAMERIEALGLDDGDHRVSIARLLRYYEDECLKWLELEDYPEPDWEEWDLEDEDTRRDFLDHGL